MIVANKLYALELYYNTKRSLQVCRLRVCVSSITKSIVLLISIVLYINSC